MEFLRHLPLKTFVGLALGALAFIAQLALGIDVRSYIPSLSTGIVAFANAAAALISTVLTIWGAMQLAKKHAALTSSLSSQAPPSTPATGAAASTLSAPAAPGASRGSADMVLLAGMAFVSVMMWVFFLLSLTGCSSSAVTPSGGEEAAAAQGTASSVIESSLPLIRVGAAVATGAVLDFAVQQSSTRTRLANEMYSAANGIYTLTGGAFPSPTQLKTTITSFGGSQADASYAQFTTAIAALYAAWYPKLNTGDTKTANDLLNAVAGGIEDATQSYVTTPAAPTTTGT